MNLTNAELKQLMKFSAISFVMDEYFGYSIEPLMKIRGENFINSYRSRNGAPHDKLNRAERNQFDKAFAEEMNRYSKQLAKWKNMTDALRSAFERSTDTDHSRVVDFSIDLLHRALDKFEISDRNDVLEDKLKDYIFESLDRIKTQGRTEDDSKRLIWAFDNFLVTNKLI